MLPGRKVALVEGGSLTWYGPSLVTGRDLLLWQLAEASIRAGPDDRLVNWHREG